MEVLSVTSAPYPCPKPVIGDPFMPLKFTVRHRSKC